MTTIGHVDAEQNSLGLDQEAQALLDAKAKLLNEIALNNGIVPTLRDENGNVLLYLDPTTETPTQLEATNQYINVEILNQNYNNAQSREVLDIKISELFKGSKKTAEDDDAAGGNVPPTVIFPEKSYILPDYGTEEDSVWPLGFTCGAGIFNEDTQQIEYLVQDTPIAIEYWVIERDTEKILLHGNDYTKFDVAGNFDDDIIDITKDYDVVLKLSNMSSIFHSWQFYDASNSTEPFFNITSEQMVRFELRVHKNMKAGTVYSGTAFINLFRNVYPIYAVFKGKVPVDIGGEVVTVDVTYGLLNNTLQLKTLDGNEIPSVTLQEINKNNKVVQEKSLVKLPLSINVIRGNTLKIAPIDNLAYNEFYHWHIADESGEYVSTGGGRTYSAIIDELQTNLAAVYEPIDRDDVGDYDPS